MAPEYDAVITNAAFLPLRGRQVVVGNIQGDKSGHFTDGTAIRTNVVTAVWPDGTVDTVNRRYLVVPRERSR